MPTVWRCDGDSDCPNGEDERECGQSKKLCSEGEYMCKPSTDLSPLGRLRTATLLAHRCIPAQWKCDGEFDCVGKDDEEGCTAVKCRDDQFMCANAKTPTSTLPSCIPKSWLCDGQADCVDRSDEEGCSVKNETCEPHEFRCYDGQCIYHMWQCDGEDDCTDGSDESNCKYHVCEKDTMFRCKTGHVCIMKKWRCDGVQDCPDHSDELDCSSVQPVRNITCASDEFKCKTSSQCINKGSVCDGDFDCPDESDEHSCDAVACKDDETRCKSGACRPKSDFCNGVSDCEDGSDEEECSATTVPPVKTPDTCDNSTEYTCPGTPLQCVKYGLLCLEGHSAGHCSSDANMCSKKTHACAPGTDYCVCRKTSKSKKEGEVCACSAGFKVLNKKCVDIDECAVSGVCDQKCTNIAGGYQCNCYSGYKLTAAMKSTDGEPVVPFKCRAVGDDPLFLLSNRAAIRQYDLHSKKYHPLINNLESAVALDYWYKNQILVWSDVAKEQIVICRIKQTNGFLQAVSECSDGSPNVTVISKDVSNPDGVAVDWVHGLLFWTDTGLDRINVINLSNLRRRVLFDKDLDEPRAIAVDPTAGLIFWSDWGHQARIERAGMNGEHRVVSTLFAGRAYGC
ncbi:Calcium binding EGF domain containing protein [Aphelenchoides avenae]|nr:Calcium binding EGF domain containing protein [Aphelenchus avenae]